MPAGAIDLGKNVPPHDIHSDRVRPRELIARPDLHPALSDLLDRSRARGAWAAPVCSATRANFPRRWKRDFPISDDADRYYKSGKRFLYRQLPFWLASLADRMLFLLVPIAALHDPGLRIVPALYRWRVRSRIYRWYGALLGDRARDARRRSSSPEARARWSSGSTRSKRGVNEIKIPLSYADQVYVLREHIGFVRNRLGSAAQLK